MLRNPYVSLLHGCPGQYHPGSALNLQTCSSIYPYISLYISLTRPLYDLRLPSRKTSSDSYNSGHQCPKPQTLRQFMPCGQNGSSNNNGSTVLGILGNTCTSRRSVKEALRSLVAFVTHKAAGGVGAGRVFKLAIM